MTFRSLHIICNLYKRLVMLYKCIVKKVLDYHHCFNISVVRCALQHFKTIGQVERWYKRTRYCEICTKDGLRTDLPYSWLPDSSLEIIIG